MKRVSRAAFIHFFETASEQEQRQMLARFNYYLGSLRERKREQKEEKRKGETENEHN
jgi:hypothetical protein